MKMRRRLGVELVASALHLLGLLHEYDREGPVLDFEMKRNAAKVRSSTGKEERNS